MRFSSFIWCLAAIVAHFMQVAHAQKYVMTALPVPTNRSLHILYSFYVFSHEEAPEKPEGQPFFKFSDLTAKAGASAGPPGASSSEAWAPARDYRGIQLSIMRYETVQYLINAKKFCCTYDDVLSGICKEKDQLFLQKAPNTAEVYSVAVGFSGAAAADVKQMVRSTGVYILVHSNCGNFADASVSGTIIAKNAYGFLPGNEYHKMPFYGWLLLVYVVLAVAWMVVSLRWWKELLHIQKCITATIFLGLVEASLWYIFFSDWNKNGVRGKNLFILSIISSVVKSTFSYMLVLVAALGWGVTTPYLDPQVITKIQAVFLLHMVLDFIREYVLSFRHSHSLSHSGTVVIQPQPFVLLCLLPVSLLNGGIFYWVFTALSSLMERLRDRQQFEKLALFQHLWKILFFALTVATLTVLLQIFNLTPNITTSWKYQWFLADGVSHILFLVVFAAMMYLWAPHKYSQRFAYSQQVDTTESAEGGSAAPQADVWAEEGQLEEDADNDDCFWATTDRDASDKKDSTMKAIAVAPAETIGASI